MAVAITLKPQDDSGETMRRVAKELKASGAMDESTRLSMALAENEQRLRDLALGNVEKLGKLAKSAVEESQARMKWLADVTRPIAAEAELLSRDAKMAQLTLRPQFMDNFDAPSGLLHNLFEQERKNAEKARREKDKAGRFIEKILQIKADAERKLKSDEQLVMFFPVGGEQLPISTIQQLDFDQLKITFSNTQFVVTPVAPIGFAVIKKKPESDIPATPGEGGYF